MGAKAKGTAFENQVARDLETLGWPYVTRASNSTGVADVIAIHADEVLFIECKTNGECRPEQWNLLYDTAMTCGAIPIIAHPNDRRRDRGGHGIRYMRCTAHKTGRGHKQPWDDITRDITDWNQAATA